MLQKEIKMNPIQKIKIICSAVTIALLLSISAFAQSAATRRLYVATSGGFELNEAAAKDALKAGADINWQNDAMGGETMLITALKGQKDAQTIKFLLDNGADANIKDDSGKTVLEWAHQYNIGRNRNGREILAMLEAAAGQSKNTSPEKTNNPQPETRNSVDDDKTASTTKQTAAKTTSPKRRDGSPSADEVKTMIEKKMTSIYEDHFCCKEKNKVEFEWLAPIQIGGQETRGRIPVQCWAAKIDLKVTFTKQSSGETGRVRRGINGDPVKEGFCIFKDAFDEWDYLTYAP
jgi:hypothetical protein